MAGCLSLTASRTGSFGKRKFLKRDRRRADHFPHEEFIENLHPAFRGLWNGDWSSRLVVGNFTGIIVFVSTEGRGKFGRNQNDQGPVISRCESRAIHQRPSDRLGR